MYKQYILVLLIYISISSPPEWKQAIEDLDYSYTSTYPTNPNYMPAIGNGYISTYLNSEYIYMAGVYNGAGAITPSHRAKIPSTVNLRAYKLNNKKTYNEDLACDMKGGRVLYQIGRVAQGSWFAHREYKDVMVYELKLLEGHTSANICLKYSPGTSDDIDFRSVNISFGGDLVSTKGYEGYTKVPEFPWSEKTKITMVTTNILGDRTQDDQPGAWDHCFDMINTKPTRILTVIQKNTEFSKTLELYNELYSKFATLENTHINAWEELHMNNGHIYVGDNNHNINTKDLGLSINSSIYDLLSSTRADTNWAPSPGGISTNSYNGHVFWDFETWMFPSFLALYPEIAKAGIKYREKTTKGAIIKGKENGYKGCMWAWESAFTGDETCPVEAPTGILEQHISGDILLSFQQYYGLHRNKTFTQETLCPLSVLTAEFLESRVEFSVRDKKFHINGVIPCDEYAVYVNDSTYTNAIWSIGLNFASNCPGGNSKTWRHIAENMYIPYDTERGYHPEYEGYPYGQLIKQADVNLLVYPMEFNKISKESGVRDLEYYPTVIDFNGPAMSSATFAISWMRLTPFPVSNNQEKVIHDYFQGGYKNNIHGPFYIWWETPTGGAPHFLTGAGGFLQTIIYGYGGIRLLKENEIGAYRYNNHIYIYIYNIYRDQNPNLARFRPFPVYTESMGILRLSRIQLLEGGLWLDIEVVSGTGNSRVKSSKGNICMRGGDGKLVVRLEEGGEWSLVSASVFEGNVDGIYIYQCDQ